MGLARACLNGEIAQRAACETSTTSSSLSAHCGSSGGNGGEEGGRAGGDDGGEIPAVVLTEGVERAVAEVVERAVAEVAQQMVAAAVSAGEPGSGRSGDGGGEAETKVVARICKLLEDTAKRLDMGFTAPWASGNTPPKGK